MYFVQTSSTRSMKRATKMDKFEVIKVLVLISSISSNVNGHLYVGKQADETIKQKLRSRFFSYLFLSNFVFFAYSKYLSISCEKFCKFTTIRIVLLQILLCKISVVTYVRIFFVHIRTISYLSIVLYTI